jgi:L-aspartate oxidase
MANGSMANGCMANGSIANGSMANGSIANGSMANGSIANGSIANGAGPLTHLWLDATGLGRKRLEEHFPTVTAACRAAGIDPAREPIPVAPGAHYSCGGVRADLAGATSLPGLYAVGEVAATGVHGANRLASNSLTEAITAGRRLGRALGAQLPPTAPPGAALHPPAAGSGAHPGHRAVLAAAMSRHAGVLRDAAGLGHLLGPLAAAPPAPPGPLDLATVEATSLHTAATLVAAAALARAESRGCHRRSDAPEPGAGPARRVMITSRDGRLELDTAGAVVPA